AIQKAFYKIMQWWIVANLVLPGKFDAARQIWCCQANLVLSGKFGAARQKFVLLITVTNVVSMANLEFVDQHNMVACLEKTKGNSDFHEIVDFLASSSIHHTLTVSPTIYTSIKDAQAAKISALKSRIKKLEKKCKPSISHHRALLKSVKRLSTKKIFGKKEFVSKQGRKKSKPESTLVDSTVFDD
ncbi:hypothetical protein Tco_1572217, partial [Tanacetum coccineum]